MKMRSSKTLSILGIVLFFITITAVVTIAVLVYGLISVRSDSDIVIALVMLSVILFLALVCTIIDVFRRKIMIDRPVKKILLATDKIASGDFSVRLAIDHSYRRYDEYDFIMENLNKMVAELAKTEVLHNDFISNVSHELKTPLAIIQNYAVLLQDHRLDDESKEKYTKTLVVASKRLTALITNILKLNKLENQELKPEYEEIDLSEMLSEIILRNEELIDSKEIEISCDFAEVKVISSIDYLEIVWNNLLSNAIKFTEKCGKIKITLKEKNNHAIVTIADNGCGISREVGDHIFDKFYQGDTSHLTEGNGLGLALVKKVIDILGGEISVDSELGKGSAFTVVLSRGIDETR